MSRTFGLLTAAALLSSVAAFAQNTETQQSPAGSPPSATTDTGSANPSAASEPGSAKSGTSMGMNRSRHHARHGRSSTDNTANALNACMASATPTPEQEQCLRQAASGSAQPE